MMKLLLLLCLTVEAVMSAPDFSQVETLTDVAKVETHDLTSSATSAQMNALVRYHLNLKTSAGSWNVGKGSVTANLTYVFDDGDIQNDDHPLLNTPSEIGPNMQISRNRFAMSLGGARLGTIDYIKSVTVKYTPAPGNVNNPCYIEQLTIIQLMPTVGKKYFCNTNLSGIMKPNEEVVFDQNC